MIKSVTIDFSEQKPQEIVSGLLEIDIQYPETKSLAIVVITNISKKWLDLRLNPKAATIETLDLAPKTFPQGQNKSMALYLNRHETLTIHIKESVAPRWYHGQEIPK